MTDADDPLALRLHSQGLPLPGMTIRAVDLATRRPLPVRRARQLLPSIGEVEPEAVRIAIRPIPGDQLSAVGPMPRTSGYYIAITHSGVTMSPFLGAVVADEIVRGRQGKGLSSPISGLRVSSTDMETHTAGASGGARRATSIYPGAAPAAGSWACLASSAS